MRSLRRLAALAVGAGGYAFYEAHSYRLVTQFLPVPAGTPALTILHVSDPHFKARHVRRAAWLRKLPDLLGELPDFVCATGDLIEGNDGIDLAISALAPLEARLGRYYVLGSHDYYVSRFRFPARYLGGNRKPVRAPRADTERLEAGLAAKGWVALTNASDVVDTPYGRIRVSGVDDPYLNRHRTDHIERRADEVAALGLVHAPDVVAEWILAGFDVVLGGHTHGGQVRLPGIGAVVTNCSLPTRLAGGLHRVGNAWLHVSPGLGTGHYTPVRFHARPEATLLRFVPGRG